MKKIFVNICIALLIFSALLTSCNKKTIDTPIYNNEIGKGVFVLNEGTFTYANSSLTFYDNAADTVGNNIFYKANMAPIGDIAQSLCLHDNSLFIVVNNSGYVYKVDAKTVKYQAKLDNLNSPRFMIPVGDGKAYISDLERTGLWVVDINEMKVTGFVETGNTTDRMIRIGDKLFVCNWSNYYLPETSNETVQVIDIASDSYIADIKVSKEPNSMVLDSAGMLWVLCSGGYSGEKEPALYRIDPATCSVVDVFMFDTQYYPSSLAIDNTGNILYFLNGGYGTLDLYSMSINDKTLPDTPFITAGSRNFYNVAVSPENGDIYVIDVKNYTQNGEVFRYTSDGNLITSFTAGIIPNYMLFNY